MLLDVLDEHVEESEILWSRRRSALRSPGLDLAGLEVLEERLCAHLDGVALLARDAPLGLEARMWSRDSDETFVAAAGLLLTRGRGARGLVLAALRDAAPPGRAGIVEALCFLPLAEDVERTLRVTVGASGDPGLGPALEVLSFHRLLPPGALGPAVVAEDPATREAAARSIGRVGGKAAWTAALAEDADTGVRDAALAAAARCGQPWALDRLQSVCRDSRRVTPEAIWLLACLGDRSDINTLRGLARRDELSQAALAGLGTLGLVECVEPLLEFAADGHRARAAGEAFRRITGLEDLERKEEPRTAGEEDRVFEDLRPLPDLEATRALWRARASEFVPGQRRRFGKSLTVERWMTVPHGGDLQTRREELTRLWALEPGLFRTLELDAPAVRQLAAA